MTERINGDFITAYTQLDEALRESYHGVEGYLAKAEGVRRYEKDGRPNFDADIRALKAMRLRYRRILETNNVKAPLASEDDVDYLRDFKIRLTEDRDPLGSLKTPIDRNNADAKRNLPIETEAREISRKIIHQKKRIAIASLVAAVLTVGVALACQFKKGKPV